MKAVIIEDESNSADVLRASIEQFTEGIEILGQAMDVKTGVSLIKERQPELVFLDIELPDGTGFDLLNEFPEIYFKIIFVTAYDGYAINAIRYAAFDYLLKPLDIDDLIAAISRLKLNQSDQKKNVLYLQERKEIWTNAPKKIMIPLAIGYELITLHLIQAVRARGNYVNFVLDGGLEYTASQPLAFYEDLLPKQIFCRIHKSHIINLRKIKYIDRGRGGKAILLNGTAYEIALRRKALLREQLRML